MKKVILVTPFPPTMGGGATNLRSLIPCLTKVDLTWIYLNDSDLGAPEYLYAGKNLMGGPLWKDLAQCLLLWNKVVTRRHRELLETILAHNADLHWVVAHNEGLLIAQHLALSSDTPVHLTIHDDPPLGMFARSRRYRWLTGSAGKRLQETLRMVDSIDVTGHGMQEYYARTLGINSHVAHRYVPELPTDTEIQKSPGLTVGHLGTIYTAEPFRLFCQALRNYGSARGLQVRVRMIGAPGRIDPYSSEFADLIEFLGEMPEAESASRLMTCDFLYAMQPFDPESSIFRQTSLPTKLTTYIMAQRPVLAHAPADGTLVPIVSEYGIGLAVHSLKTSELEEAIQRMRDFVAPANAYENVRAGLFGIENAQRLESCLLKQP